MGRPFSKELAQIPSTLEWARAVLVGRLEDFVRETSERALLAVGSGGSATAAHFAALLHRDRHWMPARHATPLEVATNEPGLARQAVLIASASGRNVDVLGAYEHAVAQEAPAIATLTLRGDSPLAARASLNDRAYVFDHDLPSGKDGYLATNSLFATMVVLLRAYGHSVAGSWDPKVALPDALGDRDSFVILHGGWGSPVATDLESKLNESALGAALPADYRNFGHGRHLWLARRGPNTAVVAVITPDVESLAERTLALLPATIPVVRLETDVKGPTGTIPLLLRGYSFVEALGRVRGHDPGKPTVPDFGRKLYGLDPRLRSAASTPEDRKVHHAPGDHERARTIYSAARSEFTRRLADARIGALAVDYDGTMCTRRERTQPLRRDLAEHCTRLLLAGTAIGIATGRGKSVRKTLQQSLPRELWSRVVVGYYNGSELGTLDDDDVPDGDGQPSPSLTKALARIESDPLLSGRVKLTARRFQVAIELNQPLGVTALMAHVMNLIASVPDLRVVASSHSVDIVTATTTKLAVVARLAERLPSGSSVLTIGDRGTWPGNDYALLHEHFSLSVDEVSGVADACWNLAPAGCHGPDATRHYLARLRVLDGFVRFLPEAER